MWSVADALGIVPAPPTGRLAALLRDWWTVPRQFGCAHVGGQAWWAVVAPDLRVWCGVCARERYDDERRCFLCGKNVRPRRAEVWAAEMDGHIRVVARVHKHCAAKGSATQGEKNA